MRSTTRAKRRTAVAAVAVLPLLLSACSAGSLGSSSGDDSATTIKLLVDKAPDNLAAAKQLAKDFQAKNPKIRVSVETRPGGASVHATSDTASCPPPDHTHALPDGRGHRGAADIAASRSDLRTVSTSSTAPARETTPRPPPSMRTRG